MGSIKGVNVNSNLTNIDPTSITNTTSIDTNLSNFFNNSNNSNDDIEELDLDFNEKVDGLIDDLIVGPVKEKVKEGIKEKVKEKFIDETGLGELQRNFNELINGKDVYYNQIEEDGFIPQGYTHISPEGYTQIEDLLNHGLHGVDLITAYNKKGKNSRIYVYDNYTGELDGIIVLDNQDHLGGVTYDKDNNILWVTANNGNVESYDYAQLMKAYYKNKNVNKKLTFDLSDKEYNKNALLDNIKIPNDINVKNLLSGYDPDNYFNSRSGMDSIYFFDGKIYSCSYERDGSLVCSDIEYKRDSKGRIKEIKEKKDSYIVDKLNGATQGLAFYKENGKTYLISSSSSYGSSKSRLTKWEFKDGKLNPIGYKYIDHAGLEGIEIKNGRITGIFEYKDKEKNDNKIEDIGSVKDFDSKKQPQTDLWYNISGNFWDRQHS